MDSGSEDEMQMAPAKQLPTPNSSDANAKMPNRKNTRATKAGATSVSKSSAKVTKPKAKGTGAKKATAKRPAGRPALKDISNAPQDGNETEEVDEFEGDELNTGGPQMNSPSVSNKPETSATKKAAVTKTNTVSKTKSARGRPAKGAKRIEEIPESQHDDEVEAQSKLAKSKAAGPKRPRPAKKDAVIPETQPDLMEVDSLAPEPENASVVDTAAIKSTTGAPSVRSTSQQPGTKAPRRREASVSDTERGSNDATLRRKLADMTKKFDSLDIKYRALYDLSTSDADSNFKQLKKLSDEKTRASNALIASLRADLASSETKASTVKSLEEQIAGLKAQNSQLTGENKKLTNSLLESQKEAKALQVKLSALRSNSTQPTEVQNGKTVPGSATKGNGPSNTRTLLVGSKEAEKEAQKRLLKEELYGDLTGLIIRDIKRNDSEGEDMYDCIQTGRNGTLHFHLTISNTASYDDAEFMYTPHLDASRDRDMLAILPDYLTEEICFPRNNAAKFYGRVVDCLTRRVAVDEEAEGGE